MDTSSQSSTVDIKTMDEVIHSVEEKLFTGYFNIKETKMDSGLVELPGISSNVFKLILSWINRRNESGARKIKDGDQFSIEDLFEWEKNLFEPVDVPTICKSFSAAEYLGLKEFQDVLASVLAGRVRGKQVDQVRQMFGIVCDIPAEELRKLELENQWIESEDMTTDNEQPNE